jgi:uncharacterized protein (DUF1499 family)
MAIQNTLVSTGAANALFVASTGTEQAITTMIFCNTNINEDAKLDLWIVPFGDIPGSAINQVLKEVSIPRTETFVMDSEKLILSSGDAVYGFVSPPSVGSNVNSCISSVQV